MKTLALQGFRDFREGKKIGEQIGTDRVAFQQLKFANAPCEIQAGIALLQQSLNIHHN